MEKICLALQFHLGPKATLEDIVPRLPAQPDDAWKQFRNDKTDGFAYQMECKEADTHRISAWLTELQEIWPIIANVVDEETKTNLAITIYVKDSTKIRMSYEVIATFEAMGCSVDIDVYHVDD